MKLVVLLTILCMPAHNSFCCDVRNSVNSNTSSNGNNQAILWQGQPRVDEDTPVESNEVTGNQKKSIISTIQNKPSAEEEDGDFVLCDIRKLFPEKKYVTFAESEPIFTYRVKGHKEERSVTGIEASNPAIQQAEAVLNILKYVVLILYGILIAAIFKCK